MTINNRDLARPATGFTNDLCGSQVFQNEKDLYFQSVLQALTYQIAPKDLNGVSEGPAEEKSLREATVLKTLQILITSKRLRPLIQELLELTPVREPGRIR